MERTNRSNAHREMEVYRRPVEITVPQDRRILD
jgi:hypothetical protein